MGDEQQNEKKITKTQMSPVRYFGAAAQKREISPSKCDAEISNRKKTTNAFYGRLYLYRPCFEA